MDIAIEVAGWILTALVWFACAHYTAKMAVRRGRSAYLWKVIGVAIGIFGLALVWLLPAKRASKA